MRLAPGPPCARRDPWSSEIIALTSADPADELLQRADPEIISINPIFHHPRPSNSQTPFVNDSPTGRNERRRKKVMIKSKKPDATTVHFKPQELTPTRCPIHLPSNSEGVKQDHRSRHKNHHASVEPKSAKRDHRSFPACKGRTSQAVQRTTATIYRKCVVQRMIIACT